jgi:site-specific recombinase XerD
VSHYEIQKPERLLKPQNISGRLLSKSQIEDFKLLDDYLVNLKTLNKSHYTIVNYKTDLKYFVKWLHYTENLLLKDVNGEIIGRYKDFLSGEELKAREEKKKGFFNWLKTLISAKKVSKPHSFILIQRDALGISSRRRHLSSLKNFFEYLKQSHEDHSPFFLKNPVKNKIHAIKLKQTDVISTPMMTREEFQNIYEKAYRPKEKLILSLLYYGGFRLSECTNLKVSQFNTDLKTITFHRKGGYVHALSPYKSELIFKNFLFYLGIKKQSTDVLFSNRNGEEMTPKAIYNLIIKMIERAYPNNPIEKNLTPHSFRKACATELYLKTKDLLLVRDYLNHKDAQVTQTYIDKATLEKFSRRIH